MPTHTSTNSETDFLLLNGDPQSSPASMKHWIAEHDEDPVEAIYLNGRGGGGAKLEVEAMTTGQLSALAVAVAGELKRRGGDALEVGERMEVRGAALGLFAVCGGGDRAA